jgi:hypothetical protein
MQEQRTFEVLLTVTHFCLDYTGKVTATTGTTKQRYFLFTEFQIIFHCAGAAARIIPFTAPAPDTAK